MAASSVYLAGTRAIPSQFLTIGIGSHAGANPCRNQGAVRYKTNGLKVTICCAGFKAPPFLTGKFKGGLSVDHRRHHRCGTLQPVFRPISSFLSYTWHNGIGPISSIQPKVKKIFALFHRVSDAFIQATDRNIVPLCHYLRVLVAFRQEKHQR